MSVQKQKVRDHLLEVDRMINEGLSGGSIMPQYSEVHQILKDKQQSLLEKESDASSPPAE